MCQHMPIWELDARENGLDTTFDDKQNDHDFYHENEYDPILFWEDLYWDDIEDQGIKQRNQKNIIMEF